ncbi:hypothetical protein M3O40_18750, partial [Xanthomonas nasturtii]|uniref:hypothetical protein n=1 Tax=Xanthomonas nasturtii TaxID=1843581 RepID=UPI002013B494
LKRASYRFMKSSELDGVSNFRGSLQMRGAMQGVMSVSNADHSTPRRGRVCTIGDGAERALAVSPLLALR